MDILLSGEHAIDQGDAAEQDMAITAQQILRLLITDLQDSADHPEIWQSFPEFLEKVPDLVGVMKANAHLLQSPDGNVRVPYVILVAMAVASGPDRNVDWALDFIGEIATDHSHSAMIQGAVFHLMALKESHNPKYDLSDKFCMRPFHEVDVLEGATTLCCASWLNLSIGDMATADRWQDVWNSETAERIRASVHDGSYRHCNKGACPAIQSNILPTRSQVAAMSPQWKAIVENGETHLATGPEKVNLAYDRTCNLSCPSCRVDMFAADSAMRTMFDRLQERCVLPMLENAKTVFVSGSGDPFASKNFRRLIERLDADAYPDLRFILMTNGMLLTRQEWARFPALHNRVQSLQISIDAATGPTHELLRRGARWAVMQDNLDFAAELLAIGQVEEFHLTFTVQAENYREMGDAVDLARRLNATGIYFGRVTNWGTFSTAEYQDKAVFQPRHPLFEDFLGAMQDPRLRDARVNIGNLIDFLPDPVAIAA